MAFSVTMPSDWVEMKQGVFDFVRGNVDLSVPVIWGKQNVPSPTFPFVSLNILTPPIPEGLAESIALDGFAVIVSTVTPSTLYSILVDATTISYTSSATPTAQEIRDGLLADIVLQLPNTIATAVGLDAIHLPFAVLDVSAEPKVSCKMILLTEADAVATFSVDAFGGSPEETTPPVETLPIISGLLAGLQKQNTVESLCRSGWGLISIEGVRKPDLVDGGRWEDRTGFDVRLKCRISQTSFLDSIETVDIGVGIQGTLTP